MNTSSFPGRRLRVEVRRKRMEGGILVCVEVSDAKGGAVWRGLDGGECLHCTQRETQKQRQKAKRALTVPVANIYINNSRSNRLKMDIEDVEFEELGTTTPACTLRHKTLTDQTVALVINTAKTYPPEHIISLVAAKIIGSHCKTTIPAFIYKRARQDNKV